MSSTEPRWFKSSYSGSGGDNCVEVASAPHAVLIRDSKDTRRTHITASADAWAVFTRHAATQMRGAR
jgi:hypothetical protein